MWIFAKLWFFSLSALLIIGGIFYLTGDISHMWKGGLMLVVGSVLFYLTYIGKKMPGVH